MKPSRRKRSTGATPSFAAPPPWSPEQALALWQCLELLREQLWIDHGSEIQRAWRDQLAPLQLPLPIDPREPF